MKIGNATMHSNVEMGRRSHWDETGGRESSPFVHCHTERPSPRAAWGPLGAGQAQAGRGGDRALPCVDPGNCRRARSGWWPGRSRPDVCERRRCVKITPVVNWKLAVPGSASAGLMHLCSFFFQKNSKCLDGGC
nr:uncharacterized protein LOC129041002 [Pongo pygmaeus]